MESLNTFSNHPFIMKHGPKLALVLAILLLLALLISSGLTVRDQVKIKAKNYTPQPVKPINKSKRPKYRINDVVSANLFGDPSPKKVVKNAPKTTLDLTLHGILSASDTSVARAIISSSKNKKAELYSVDEKIKGAGASIKEIRAQEVILNRNGSIESLPLKKKESKGNNIIFSTATTPTSNRAARTNSTNSNAVARPISANGEPRKIRKPNFSGLDRALEKLDKT